MKRIFSYLILILCSLTCFACKDKPSISCSYDVINIDIFETFKIEDEDIIIENFDRIYNIEIEDESIATISDMIITPIKKGETTVKIVLEDNKDCFEISLNVTDEVMAKVANFQRHEIQIDMVDNAIVYNKLYTNKGCNEIPQVTYDESIISYDYITGKIEAKKIGETEVIVSFASCWDSFKVVVVGVVYTKKIEVSDCKVYLGTEGIFEYNVFPSTANTYSFSTNNALILRVYPDGRYVAKSIGEVVVTVKYLTSATSLYTYEEFKVEVVETIEDFDISILDADNNVSNYFIDEFEYKIAIPRLEEWTKEDFKVSNNVIVNYFGSDKNNYYIYFNFLAIGNQNIEINIHLYGNANINKTINCSVNEIKDISVKAKWMAYEFLPKNDGKFYIYKDLSGYPGYLIFNLKINDLDLKENYKIYDTTSGNRVEIDKKFLPESLGEYTLEFVYNEILMKRIQVVFTNHV